MIYGGENHINIPRKWVKYLIIQFLIASLLLFLTNPTQARPFTQWMVWDFENNKDSWSNQFNQPNYPNAHCGFDTTDQKINGSYSIFVKADATPANDGWIEYASNGTITGYDWHSYFWIRMNATSISGVYTGFAIGLWSSSPTMMWQIGFEPTGTAYRAGIYIGSQGHTGSERFTYGASPTVFSMNTWYAFWFDHNNTAGTSKFYYSTDAISWTLEYSYATVEAITPTSWRIDHQENAHVLHGFIDYLVVTDEAGSMYPPPPPPPYVPPQDFVGDYFGTGIFIGGIFMMIYAPTWVAWGIKKKGVTPDTVERLGYAMLIFIVGLGLFFSYIYRGA